MSPERPGVLNVHLNPDKLDAFKAYCSEQGTTINEVMEELIGEPIEIPERLARYAERPLLSRPLAPELSALRAELSAR